MKKLLKVLILPLFVLVFAGCRQAGVIGQTVTPSPSLTKTIHPTTAQTPTVTQTPFLTETSTPSPSHTPTRTVTPTATATFDPVNLALATRAPAESCPVGNPAVKPILPEQVGYAYDLAQPILDALNSGVTFDGLQSGVNQVESKNVLDADASGNLVNRRYENTLSRRELTGDGVPEVVFHHREWLAVYQCYRGRYTLALDIQGGSVPRIVEPIIEDANGNGIPEIVVSIVGDPMHGSVFLYLYQWDGSKFSELILPDEENAQDVWGTAQAAEWGFSDAFIMSICSNVSVTDLDHNGTKEVVIRTIACDFGEVGYTGPYRWSILALTWNGDHFQPLPERLDPPEYRFQAVQDGDVETQRGNYEEAMRFYRQALNDRQLKGWSEELYHQQWDRYTTREGTPTPTPAPVDPNEYAVLSAYIRYRFMLIHIAQGNADQAQAEFEAFQQEVLPGQPGDDYLLLARKFWTAYQPQHNLAAACAATRAYAHDLRKQLLYPIDSTWHGWQVQDYGTLICPFE